MFASIQVLVTDIPGTSVGTIVPAIHDLLLSSPILKILPRCVG